MASSIRVARYALTAAFSLVVFSGCSVIVAGKLRDKDDAGMGSDMSSVDLSSVDLSRADLSNVDGSASGCVGATNGTMCELDPRVPEICFASVCVESVCGDGFIDGPGGEICDDNNTSEGDGCDNDCKPSCVDASECNDGSLCTDDTCADSICKNAPAVDGTICEAGGACMGGICTPIGCGNGSIESASGEECDPPDGSACLADCTWQCTDLRGCDDGDLCNGSPTCSEHACTAEPMLDCVDADACTVDSCDPALGCQNVLTDADGDTYGPLSCGGLDCKDTDATVNPDATEVCNGVDDDCNGAIDDRTMVVDWYPDRDRDGYGDSGATPMSSCMPIMGSVTDSRDCDDRDSNVHPQGSGSPAFFSTPRSDGTYDYDCNGRSEVQFGPPMCARGGRNFCPLGSDSCDGTPGFTDARTICGNSYTLVGCASCATTISTCRTLTVGTAVQKCR